MRRSCGGLTSTSSAACPTPDEARAFLADSSPDKRARLVDRLLDRPEYADHWANKWMDLLRPNPYRVGIKAVFNLDAWIRDAFRRNMPYDQFVREIVTARGSTFERGPVDDLPGPSRAEEIAPMVSQLFLGIRLECAKCHHHPFESWGQERVLRVRRLLRAAWAAREPASRRRSRGARRLSSRPSRDR